MCEGVVVLVIGAIVVALGMRVEVSHRMGRARERKEVENARAEVLAAAL